MPVAHEWSKTTVEFYQIDPTQDPRWSELVNRHSRASVFHTATWLQALQHTYRYQPVAFTTSPPASELKNGLVGCEIDSWVTGRRLVSLPFSDHCEPLFDSSAELLFMIRSLQANLTRQKWKYLEVRPIDWNLGQLDESTGFSTAARYFLHRLNLQGEVETVFGKLDKDSLQRRIHHAERAGLVEKCGSSEELLAQFYRLFVVTRSRHQVPPMPYVWFQNLMRTQKEFLKIRVAYSAEKPVASILTLRFRDVLYYKYGCSDARFNSLGAMPWLLWKAALDAKLSGAREFDLGRTEENNPGLLTFKNHWDPQPLRLAYWKFPYTPSFDSINSWKLKLAKRVFSHMPGGMLTLTGKIIYRHIG